LDSDRTPYTSPYLDEPPRIGHNLEQTRVSSYGSFCVDHFGIPEADYDVAPGSVWVSLELAFEVLVEDLGVSVAFQVGEEGV
jgi:hypothetical protein